jgi:hypothetical protein
MWSYELRDLSVAASLGKDYADAVDRVIAPESNHSAYHQLWS